MEKTKTPSNNSLNLISHIYASIIVFPILFLMLYSPILYLILMYLVISLSHKEFYVIESKIMKQLFLDQFSSSTSSTLISSPLQTYIILLIPTLFYLFKNSECLSSIIVLFILTIYRISSFITIHKQNSIHDFDIKQELTEAVNDKGIQKMKNPIPTQNFNTSLESFIQSRQDDSMNSSKAPPVSTLTSFKNSFNKKFITEKMLISCLIVICFDYLFIVIYAIPLCYGISLHHLGVGFIYISLVVVIAFSCDLGDLFIGMRFSKRNFGAPISTYKTYEGIYGSFFLTLINSILFKILATTFSRVKFMNIKSYILFVFIEIFISIFGDFFENFLKRCGDITESGTIFQGYGGVLDRIDSITLGLPIAYFFAKTL